ncbi:MAG: hypothetical protein KIS66_01250 [Fimbriimonadaceae bacterium]|nr:hypothetical protein [Fimbriimonadaceae bacterium]
MNKTTVALVLLVLMGLVGCGNDPGMTQKEIDDMKNSPRMTEADRAKVAEGFRKGAEATRAQQSEWAAGKSPEEVARINAERAKLGRPPLGQ